MFSFYIENKLLVIKNFYFKRQYKYFFSKTFFFFNPYLPKEEWENFDNE